MSIDRIRYFSAVVETRNLRKASELMGISPPSMSKAISVLEKELGYRLIHPEGRGIGITEKGMQIYRLSTSLLEEQRLFYQRIKEGDSSSQQIRMATFEVFSSHFMSAFLLQEKDYEFMILEHEPGRIEQSIIEGVVDVGITYLPSPDTRLDFVEIGSFVMKAYGLKKWEKIPFCDWPFAIPTTELKIHSSEINSLDMWPSSGPKREVKYYFELLETAIQTSIRGLSVLYCPDFIVKLTNENLKPTLQLVPLPMPESLTRTKSVKVYLVGRKGSLSVELERKMAKFMRSLK